MKTGKNPKQRKGDTAVHVTLTTQEKLKDLRVEQGLTLAKFYGVSIDYLLGLTENKKHPNAALADLHLSVEKVWRTVTSLTEYS